MHTQYTNILECWLPFLLCDERCVQHAVGSIQQQYLVPTGTAVPEHVTKGVNWDDENDIHTYNTPIQHMDIDHTTAVLYLDAPPAVPSYDNSS